MMLRKIAPTVCLFLAVLATPAHAAPIDGGTTEAIRIGVVLTVLAIVPALLISTTSFIRIIVVLAMIRHAFGMPQTPPNAVLTSLALFLTAFVMGPTIGQLNSETIQPFIAGDTDIAEVLDDGGDPLKEFMLAHVRDDDLEMIYSISQTPLPTSADEVEMLKLIPAFILNELRVAFTIGFVIMLPFLLIDLVVASILLSLGMMMVPPTTISLPIKVLMFVLIDGWSLVVQGLLGSFM